MGLEQDLIKASPGGGMMATDSAGYQSCHAASYAPIILYFVYTFPKDIHLSRALPHGISLLCFAISGAGTAPVHDLQRAWAAVDEKINEEKEDERKQWDGMKNALLMNVELCPYIHSLLDPPKIFFP